MLEDGEKVRLFMNQYASWSFQVELSGAVEGHDKADLPPDLDEEGAEAIASLAI